MSYDLTVYAKLEVAQGSVLDLYSAMSGDRPEDRLALRDGVNGGPGLLVLDLISIDGPLAIEPEDVPEHIAKVAKGLRYIYQLSTPYRSETNMAVQVEEMSRFARELADAGKGVWVDEQSGEVWRGERRIATEPLEGGERYDEVEFRWYVLQSALPSDAVGIYVDACTRWLLGGCPRLSRVGTATASHSSTSSSLMLSN